MNPKPSAPQRNAVQRGFSLIELMIIVAIIGIMASIAIPSFKGALVRAKKGERNLLLDAIYRSIQEYYNSNNYAFPNSCGGTVTCISTAFNPTYTPPFTSAPKLFDATQPGWNLLAFAPEGQMRYSYNLTAQSDPNAGTGFIQVQSIGDADQDGIAAYHWINYTLQPNSSWTIATSDFPPNQE